MGSLFERFIQKVSPSTKITTTKNKKTGKVSKVKTTTSGKSKTSYRGTKRKTTKR
jgi:hypothetical protein